MPPPPVTLIFDLLTLKMVPESRVMWATPVPILVFLGLSVLDLGPMYATDRQTDVRQHHRLMPRLGGGIIKENSNSMTIKAKIHGERAVLTTSVNRRWRHPEKQFSDDIFHILVRFEK